MKLIYEFEGTQPNFMNWEPDEQHLFTQTTIERHNFIYSLILIAYTTQGKPRGRNMSIVYCVCCKK